MKPKKMKLKRNDADKNEADPHVCRWSRLDSALGAVLRVLEERGILEETVVIVVSDNGAAKGDLYEQGVRVPLIMRYPHLISAGSLFTQVVRTRPQCRV